MKFVRIALIILIVVLILLIIATPIYFFTSHFHDSPESDDIAKWGAFGDYFGGTLNTLFSFLSLIVTTIIAFLLINIDKNRHQESQEFERKKLLREFREHEFKKINNQLLKVWTALTEQDVKKARDIAFICSVEFRYFKTSNTHLFNVLIDDPDIIKVQKTLDDIVKTLGTDVPLSNLKKDELVERFVDDFDKFNIVMQNYLLDF